METPQPFVTFIVRLNRSGEDWAGVIERVATGEKRRCQSLNELGRLIGAMARAPASRTAALSSRDQPIDEEDSDHDDVDA